MLPAIHGLFHQHGLNSFGVLEAHYNFRVPTVTSPEAFKNTVQDDAGTLKFIDGYDFAGKGRTLPVPILANCPIFAAGDAGSGGAYASFSANQWFERLTPAGAVMKSFAVKLKGIPSPLSVLNFCMDISSPGLQNDVLALGNFTGAVANETIGYFPSNVGADALATSYMPAAEWFTVIVNPVAKKIYVDGVERTLLQPGGAVVAPAMDLKIGQRITNATQKFTGGIQQVAIWSTEITAADVPAIHDILK